MGQHAKLSPSSAHRWFKCPGSVRLAARYADAAGPAAREGSFAHHIAERCLKEKVDASSFVGLASRSGEFTCSEEMAAAVQVYVDAVRSVAVLEGGDVEVLVEARVRLPAPLDGTVYGTADALVWSRRGRRLHVFDFKYGAGVAVPAVGNVQLRLYQAGAVATFPDRVRFGARNLEVVGHIVQPRGGGEAWRSDEAGTAADLVDWVCDEVVPAVRATEAPDAELVPGEGQCRFCPAKVDCPALRERALAVARDVFADEALTEPELPDVVDLPVEIVGQLMRAAPLVRDYLRAVEERGAELASAGQRVPGFKLVQRTGLRKWNDEAKAEAALRAASVEPFERPKLLSPAKAEKALGRARAKLVAELAHKPVTGSLLVPDSDKRPAIDAAAVFPSVLD